MAELTPLGELLERAREGLGLSGREAARRAGISESRWRQVVTGRQRSGDISIPANPRRGTVVNMARAVDVAEEAALTAAGMEVIAGRSEPAAQQSPRPATRNAAIESLIQEIFDDQRIPEARKQEMVRGLRRAEAERQAVQDEITRWRRAG